MKRISLLSVLILSFFSLTGVLAQEAIQAIPIDANVRYGILENGLTYYIRKNNQPQQRAEFFIAQKVGSILEEDSQAGLAHFLEHMAFNGTKNFPGKAMINYLETIGVKFGENLNAYTSFDETVYNISNVPVSREGIVDSCLLVLHDWSGFISLHTEEIDKERGVIREEMRTRNDAGYRQIEKLLPMIMPGSQYAKRMPIGTEEVVMHFKPKELRDYYHKWYRPDLQAIIIIGDIDVDQIEAKIKTLFADIPKPENAAERVYYEVPNNEKPIVAVVQDKESTSTLVSIYYKNDPMPDNLYASTAGLVMNYMQSIVTTMFNERLAEIREKANPPFLQAGVRQGPFIVAKTKDAWNIYAAAKEEGIEEALKSITREVQRVKQFGFTESEYQRAQINVLKFYENAYNERGKTKNNSYAREYVSHFTKGGYIPGIEYEYTKTQEIAPHITVEYINQYFSKVLADTNLVISLSCREKDGFVPPTEELILNWFQEAQAESLEAYVDQVSSEPLLDQVPNAGALVSLTENKPFGTTEYVLSNGVKVLVKPTHFKDDEILLVASSPGGSSLFPANQLENIKTYSLFSSIGGLKNLSSVELKKVLAGKKVASSASVSLRKDELSGYASPKDLETLLQLVYLQFTAPRIDTEAFESGKSRLYEQLKSQEANPSMALVDTYYKHRYQSPERQARLKPQDVDKVNYQTIMEWRKQRYADASDFTFILVGNLNPAEVEPLLVQYLGSLPASNKKEQAKDINILFTKGKKTVEFEQKMENPLTTTINSYTGTLAPTLANRIYMNMLEQILRIVYTEKVREDEGGTYGVGVNGAIMSYPKGQTQVQISYDTNADKRKLLNKIIHDEFKALAKNGPRAEDFQKVKEFMLKKQLENEQENKYWLGVIQKQVEDGYDAHTQYTKILSESTPKNIKELAAKLHKQGNLLEVIMVGVPR